MTLPNAQAPRPIGVPGLIYTLHLDRPFSHARHYTGWTPDRMPACGGTHPVRGRGCWRTHARQGSAGHWLRWRSGTDFGSGR